MPHATRRSGSSCRCGGVQGRPFGYAEAADRLALREKVDQVLDLGVRGVTLLFDDIPGGLPGGDADAFDSFGHAHAEVANELHAHLRSRGDVPLLLCPTEYCDRFATRSVEESPYLHALGAHLAPGIDVYWTGPEIVSEMVPVEALERFARVVRRAPVLWDNLHANDYDGRRLYLGPYAGRSQELRARLRGVIANPSVEYALYPYTWDLEEAEGEVWARFAAQNGGRFCRPEALPNTYRTGILDDLQALLLLDRDGCARP